MEQDTDASKGREARKRSEVSGSNGSTERTGQASAHNNHLLKRITSARREKVTRERNAIKVFEHGERKTSKASRLEKVSRDEEMPRP